MSSKAKTKVSLVEKKALAQLIKKSYAQFLTNERIFLALFKEFESISDVLLNDTFFDRVSDDRLNSLFTGWFTYYISLRDEFILLHYGNVLREKLAYAKNMPHTKSLRTIEEFIQDRESENSLDDASFKKVCCSERGIIANLKKLGVSCF